MNSNSFFLPEEDFYSVQLVPVENLSFIQQWIQQGQTRIVDEKQIQIPALPYPLKIRKIEYIDLEDLMEPRFIRKAKLTTGNVSDELEIVGGFAFADEELGAFYGRMNTKGIIREIGYIGFDEESPYILDLQEVLQTLGNLYALIMVDWWQKLTVDLSDAYELESFLNTGQFG